MLTAEQVKLLKDPFAVEDHEHRAGGGDGLLTYITEEPLIDRLNEVDPSWQFKVVSILISDYGGDRPDTVTVHAELTLCEITRANVGTAIANVKTWEGSGQNRRKLDKPEVQSLAEMDIKGAVTDALKRCARMFGVGGYLLRLKGVKINSEADFARWYRQQFGGPQPAKLIQTPADPQEPRHYETGANGSDKRDSVVDHAQTDEAFQAITWTRDDNRVKRFTEWARNFWQVEGENPLPWPQVYRRIAKALALTIVPNNYEAVYVAMMNEYGGSPEDAMKMVQLYEPTAKAKKEATTG